MHRQQEVTITRRVQVREATEMFERGDAVETAVLLSARPHLDGPGVQRLREALAEAPQGDRLAVLLKHHRMLSLFHDTVRSLGLEAAVPPALAREAKREHLTCHFAARRKLETLDGVLIALARAGIKTVVLKGAHLARDVYPRPALRPFEDIDLLIRKDDFPRARDTLFKAGFTYPSGLLAERYYLRHHFHVPFFDPRAPLYLELHWSLLDTPLQRPGEGAFFFENTSSLAGAGKGRSACLNPVASILYLALHIDKHGFMNRFLLESPLLLSAVVNPASQNRLIWFIDVALIIEKHRDALNWDAMAEHAQSMGIEERVHASLAILARLLEDERLGGWATRFTAHRRHRVRTWVCHLAARRLSGPAGQLPRGESLLFRMSKGAQFRPIKLLDAWDRVFPGARELRRLYGAAGPVRLSFRAGLHAAFVLADGLTNLVRLCYHHLRTATPHT